MFTSAEHALVEHVGGVTGRAEAQDFQRRALALDVFLNLGEQLFGVLDRIALGQLVGLEQNLAVFGNNDGFRRGRTAIHADHAAHDLTGLELRLLELRNRVGLAERRRCLAVVRGERWARLLAEPRAPAVQDEVAQRVDALEEAIGAAVGDAVDRRAERRVPGGRRS